MQFAADRFLSPRRRGKSGRREYDEGRRDAGPVEGHTRGTGFEHAGDVVAPLAEAGLRALAMP